MQGEPEWEELASGVFDDEIDADVHFPMPPLLGDELRAATCATSEIKPTAGFCFSCIIKDEELKNKDEEIASLLAIQAEIVVPAAGKGSEEGPAKVANELVEANELVAVLESQHAVVKKPAKGCAVP